ncbi:MAG: helix-turn-helix domain-containing protein [Candidatus Omnitrophica bacterium]|nr:helix-turn-helix domain-containing protein [Candidatus Omnitrophota bacterium]
MENNGHRGDRVLTIQELSDYLKIPVPSLYVLTKQGKVPGTKVGKHWRYLESDILGMWPPKLIRLISAITAVIFLTTTVLWAQPGTFIHPVSIGSKLIQIPLKINVPFELGSIQTDYRAGENRPFIVYIQDAHSIVDAQTNIKALINHLQIQYGISLVALEGGRGKLDPTLFRAFPNEFVKRRVLNRYLDRGEITGAGMAAIFNAKEADYYGIENWDLYEKNFLAYLWAYREKDKISDYLEKVKGRLDEQRRKVYSKELNEFHEQGEAFDEERIHLVEYLKFLMRQPGLSAQQSDDEIRTRYPHLAVLFSSLSKDESSKRSDLDASIRRMAEAFAKKYSRRLKRKQLMKFNEYHQAYRAGQLDEGGFLKLIIECAQSVGLKPKLTPEMKDCLGYVETLTTIKGTKVFEELASLTGEIQRRLIRTDRERQLAAQYEKIRLLKGLASLELVRDELAQYQKAPDDYLSMLGEMRKSLDPALAYYETALERDRAFHRNLNELLEKEKTNAAIVVAGGFHTQGFEESLRESGYSYAVITPRIHSLYGEEIYHEIMQGRLSYKPYYRTTLYDALMRHASLKLVNSLDQPEFKRILKYWRDEVLRRLAKEGRITAASDYTRYIDFLVKLYFDKFGKLDNTPKTREKILKALDTALENYREDTVKALWDKFQVQFRTFSQGLRGLIERNALTPKNLSALLEQSGQSKVSVLGTFSAVVDLIPRNPTCSEFLLSPQKAPLLSSTTAVQLPVDQLVRYVGTLDRIAGNRVSPELMKRVEVRQLADKVFEMARLAGPEMGAVPDATRDAAMRAEIKNTGLPYREEEIAAAVREQIAEELVASGQTIPGTLAMNRPVVQKQDLVGAVATLPVEEVPPRLQSQTANPETPADETEAFGDDKISKALKAHQQPKDGLQVLVFPKRRAETRRIVHDTKKNIVSDALKQMQPEEEQPQRKGDSTTPPKDTPAKVSAPRAQGNRKQQTPRSVPVSKKAPKAVQNSSEKEFHILDQVRRAREIIADERLTPKEKVGLLDIMADQAEDAGFPNFAEKLDRQARRILDQSEQPMDPQVGASSIEREDRANKGVVAMDAESLFADKLQRRVEDIFDSATTVDELNKCARKVDNKLRDKLGDNWAADYPGIEASVFEMWIEALLRIAEERLRDKTLRRVQHPRELKRGDLLVYGKDNVRTAIPGDILIVIRVKGNVAEVQFGPSFVHWETMNDMTPEDFEDDEYFVLGTSSTTARTEARADESSAVSPQPLAGTENVAVTVPSQTGVHQKVFGDKLSGTMQGIDHTGQDGKKKSHTQVYQTVKSACAPPYPKVAPKMAQK